MATSFNISVLPNGSLETNNSYDISIRNTSWSNVIQDCIEKNIMIASDISVPYGDIREALRKIIEKGRDGEYAIQPSIRKSILRQENIDQIILEKNNIMSFRRKK